MNDWAAAGGGNDVYIGQRLLYRTQLEEGDQAFGATSGQAFRSAIIGIFLLGIALFFLVGLVLGLVLRWNNPGLLLLLLLGCFIVVGLIPERQWVSQWELTLDGRAQAEGSAYAAIAKALRDRQIPVTVEPRRVRSSIGGDVRNYLVINRGRYSVYVGVFPYGTGLFMTWSMWLDMSRLRIIGRYLAEMIATLVGRGSHFHYVIRSDPDRALREAVHNATREGVEAAVAGTELSVEAILGEIVVEDELSLAPTRPSTPAPGPASGPSTRPIPARPVAPPPVPVAQPPVAQPSSGTVAAVALASAPRATEPPAAAQPAHAVSPVPAPAVEPAETAPSDATPGRGSAVPESAGFCTGCGKPLFAGLAFCVACGTPVPG